MRSKPANCKRARGATGVRAGARFIVGMRPAKTWIRPTTYRAYGPGDRSDGWIRDLSNGHSRMVSKTSMRAAAPCWCSAPGAAFVASRPVGRRRAAHTTGATAPFARRRRAHRPWELHRLACRPRRMWRVSGALREPAADPAARRTQRGHGRKKKGRRMWRRPDRGAPARCRWRLRCSPPPHLRMAADITPAPAALPSTRGGGSCRRWSWAARCGTPRGAAACSRSGSRGRRP